METTTTPQCPGEDSPMNSTTPTVADPESMLIHNEHKNVNMVNPLSSGPPEYIKGPAGKLYYLGHTSTWSLTIRLLNLTHGALYKCPFPSTAHHIDSVIYDLKWNGMRSQAVPDIRGLPTIDHALFLINAAKFHTGQIFHLFDEASFMDQLYRFYKNPVENVHTAGLWLPHFLVIIALGKAFVGAQNRGNMPPGSEFFRAALMMLPDYSFLWKEPSVSAEILCAFALYLQSIDWRTSAHNMVHGYHTDLSTRFTNEQELVRCQNIWWTVYILERQISVLMGTPLSISDNDINTPLPLFPDSPPKTATLLIHVKLSKAFSRIVNALYRDTGNMESTFVKSTQEVLQRVADVACELRENFPVPDQGALSGISRVSGYLNLLYHQCIMLATRPFLFMLVEIRAKGTDPQTEVPTPIQLLLQICLESAKKTSQILGSLQDQNLLECFLPFDLESAVSAALVVTMASLVDLPLIANRTSYLDLLLSVLDQMIDHGNLIALDKKRKVHQLESLCVKLKDYPSSSLINTSDPLQLEQRNSQDDNLDPSISSDGRDSYLRQNIHAEGSRKDFEEEQEQEDLATDACRWANDISPSRLLEAANMLEGGSLLDWADLPSSSFLFGFVGGE
ncbi:hypothetical protein LT330_007988 [Penicillium expansum]|uniref:Transcription factor, fungi n=1 Tax=Penicillium expansum TaxID=27334 RepID=A0A0A2JNE2_PENEN|nr:Transcription factor, fungi [Penicillium expansum]KAK4866825.1 hypothetical protein LT330_007988 [Penicillium expansum]KGO48300.1 Transcription factor, fungi [Penicillium expansum]KGO53780.1 Transcription factor, fungi [Penicillium expansum]KGO70305.1 Transcription factor, fungi [Penicillium expansum]